jgi:hypothetical protein
VLALLDVLVFLTDKANEFLAVDPELQVFVHFGLILVFVDIWISELIPGLGKRCGNLLFEEGVIIDSS